MTKTIKTRQPRRKNEVLSPLSGRAYISVETESDAISALREGASVRLTGNLPPGFRREPRALLYFVLRVLDGKHRQMVQQHLADFMRFDQHGSQDMGRFQRQLRDDPALWRCAVEGMISAMREMADMWIDSGKSTGDRDVDTPADRNVEDHLHGRDCSLALRIYRSLLRSHPVYKEMRRDGSTEIKDTYPQFEVDKLRGFLRREDAMRAHGAKWAAFYFSRLLDSPDSRSISRCDHCNSYFAYQRARLRTVKHGVFCPDSDCKTKASVKRTEASRHRRLDTAAKEWLRMESKEKGIPDAKRIAWKVNAEHHTAFGKRWVNQNKAEILRLVEELRNAKG